MDWVILFGGSGREECISALLDINETVRAIIIPKNQNDRLKSSINVLKKINVRIIEVDRGTFNQALLKFNDSNLLSIGFPYLIDESTLEKFQFAINIHPSLLPKYRGPTSGAYVLINKEKITGSTVHFMSGKMDQGNIIVQSEVVISRFDSIRSLQKKVYKLEPELLKRSIHLIKSGYKGKTQNEDYSSEYIKKRTPEDSELDSRKTLIELYDFIRACDPDDYPAFFYVDGQKICLKIWRPNKSVDEQDEI